MIDLETVPEVTLDELFPDGVTVCPEIRLVDVRSPSEFAQDHVPGSRSVPLFDDSERTIIGTLFRQSGQHSAQAWGEERVERRIEAFTESLLAALDLGEVASADRVRRRVVLCARGGLRSSAVVDLLRSRGHDVERLQGGYRSFRRYVRSQLSQIEIPSPIVLHGLTGVGKTRILREIARRCPQCVLDLEGIAQHRSSVLGAVGLQPVSQKRFESQLAATLRQLSGPVTFAEWEARRLGNREIPAELHRSLASGRAVWIEATRDQRVDQLVRDYVDDPLARGAHADDIVRQLRDGVRLLERFPSIGRVGVGRLCDWLDEREFSNVAGFLLDHHYDARYRHAQTELAVEATFELTTAEAVAEALLEWTRLR